MIRISIAATLVVAGTLPRASAAADAAPISEGVARTGPPGCAGPLDAEAVVRCALSASPEVREARAQVAAAEGRRTTADVLLPNNPTLSGTVSNRRRPPPEEASVLNWSVVLSQELQIAGQRGARVDVADADVVARNRRLGVAEQEVAAGALAAYFEAVAAEETYRFAAALADTAQALATYAEGRAKEAVLAGIEADVARAEATRIALVRFEAERRVTDARAVLGALLDVMPQNLKLADGLPPAPRVNLPTGSLEEQALRLRGEVAAAEMERQVLERRLVLVRRERIPNPTISAFAEKGEINDRILGIGLSFPLPLPSPLGQTRAGQIAENVAQIRAAEASEELVRRRVRVEVARAQSAFKARQGAAALFTPDLLTRARADLGGLREALASRQLSLREGLQWQRSLIELLQADIEARLGRALAWVDLRRVVGIPLAAVQGGGR